MAADLAGPGRRRLAVTHRHPGERWRRSERAALDDAARRAAALVWAALLTADLQAGRERIVAGREEERRRLRHDLHDGVGPELAGMALQLERLAGKLAADPDLAALAGRLRDQMRRTVAAVRRAVDDLRPPALDELGLVAALREHVAAYRMPVPAGGAGGEVDGVTVTAEDLPPLRAAVEVAAYRIATEAVSNAVRHAEASTCTVSLRLSGEDLLVEITDDGRGAARRRRPRRGVDEHAGAGRRARRLPRRDHRRRCRHHRPRAPAAGGPVSAGGVPIRVVVVDDHPVYRDGVADALGDEPDIEVVGTAADGERRRGRRRELQPDVVLMDLRMPGVGGLAGHRRASPASSPTPPSSS